MTKWLIIALAALGVGVAVVAATLARREPPPPPAASAPPVNPFERGIAGAGIVEAKSRNIRLSAPEPGLVTDVMVQVNDTIKTGQPLFALDSRTLKAQLLTAESALTRAQTERDRLGAMPRPEEIPPLQASVEQATADYENARDDYQRNLEASKGGAASAIELLRKRYAMESARAALDRTQADLELKRAGAWSWDLAVANATVADARAQVDATKGLIERLTVRSPIDGTVLKRNIEPGEFTTTTGSDPALIVGDLSTLNVRAQVDEEDLPRLSPGARAVARPRGRADLECELRFVRIEPWAKPKVDLTGMPQERVDTRVVEVIYEVVKSPHVRLYPGQVMDVFIQVKPATEPGEHGTASSG